MNVIQWEIQAKLILAGCNAGSSHVVSGREFNLGLLHRLDSDIDQDAILGLLEEGLLARVIEERPDSVGYYHFTHALIQETLVNEVSLTRRARVYAAEADFNHMNWPEALEKCLKAVELIPSSEDILTEVMARFFTANVYRETGDYDQALRHAFDMLDRAERLRHRSWLAVAYYVNETMYSYRADWNAAGGFGERGLASGSMTPVFLGRKAVME